MNALVLLILITINICRILYKNFCIQFFEVACETTVPFLPYCIMAIVTEHAADADPGKESYHENRADH